MKSQKHNAILSIAGYDPSGGAGVLADCKTFEQIGEYGCAISTAITYQNDVDFGGLNWLSFEEIEKQFQSLEKRFEFRFVKIGLIENLNTLSRCISMLRTYDPNIKIIWDPILKASAGFQFHANMNEAFARQILNEIYLITPNIEEAKELNLVSGNTHGNILFKGGHDAGNESIDTLYENGEKTEFKETRLNGYSKHGSGCVLSAAITAYLNKSYSLKDACKEAKQYTLSFLKSSPGRIGFHFLIPTHEIAG